ncbi:kinase-like protein, partial [Calocera cornea HHB12733]
VAMKVMCAGFSSSVFARNELAFLRRIKEANPGHPGYCHVLTLLSNFSIPTVLGRHSCLVTPLLAQPLSMVMAHSLPLSWKKKAIREILLGLVYLHDECGIIHTDLSGNNILVQIPDMIKISDIALTKEGWIELSIAEEPPTVAFPVQSVHGFCNCILTLEGTASWKEGVHTEMVQSNATRAPEVRLGGPWNSLVDEWSLGHVVYELVTGSHLIQPPSMPGQAFDDDYCLAYIRVLLGDYSKEFLQECRRADTFFHEQGAPQTSPSRMGLKHPVLICYQETLFMTRW